MIRVLVNGATGRMGSILTREIGRDPAFTLACRVNSSGREGCRQGILQTHVPCDVVIDFSSHEAATELAQYAQMTGTPLVIATTGYTQEDMECIRQAAEVAPIFLAPNLSIGVAFLAKMVKQATKVFSDADVEIVEVHHNGKLDAPSGTALMLADAIKEIRGKLQYRYGRHGQHKRSKGEIGIHSLRMGNTVGTHEVIFATEYETITLRHEAQDRALFARGALSAAEFLIGKPAGLYGINDLVRAGEDRE